MIFAFDAGPLSQSPWDAWDAAQNKSVSGQWMYLPAKVQSSQAPAPAICG